MNVLLGKMSKMVELQHQIMADLEYVVETEQKSSISGSAVDIARLEDIEKYYFMLDTINKNTLSVLNLAKKQKEQLKTFSTKIRTAIHKETHIHNDNKFITVLDSHFNNTGEDRFNPDQHRDMYNSIKRYHELHTNDVNPTYILHKSVALATHTIDVPVATNLENIPSMFRWWAGDNRHKSGVYMCIAPDFYFEVPFPDLISKNSKNFKHKSVPCKYRTAELCHDKQLEFSKIYNTELRQCNFVHVGESYIKIGSDFRCPNLPSFGAHDTLTQDLANVSLTDIKNILMNASSDLLLIMLWYSHHRHLGEVIFTGLDKFN